MRAVRLFKTAEAINDSKVIVKCAPCAVIKVFSYMRAGGRATGFFFFFIYFIPPLPRSFHSGERLQSNTVGVEKREAKNFYWLIKKKKKEILFFYILFIVIVPCVVTFSPWLVWNTVGDETPFNLNAPITFASYYYIVSRVPTDFPSSTPTGLRTPIRCTEKKYKKEKGEKTHSREPAKNSSVPRPMPQSYLSLPPPPPHKPLTG